MTDPKHNDLLRAARRPSMVHLACAAIAYGITIAIIWYLMVLTIA